MKRKLLFALVVAVLLAGVLQHLNTIVMRVTAGGGQSVLRPLAMAAAFGIAALVTWFASARAGRELTPGFIGGTLLCLAAAGYPTYLALVRVHRFGSAATEPPLRASQENYPHRGEHTYRTNSFGFRGPEWGEAKPRGTLRGIVIGDSMVFGSGVDDQDTIDAALARRLRRAHAGTPVEV